MNLSLKKIVIFSLFITYNLSAQNTFYVSTTGSNSATGSITNPWQTIEYGANLLQPGDTLLVRQGTYNGYFGISAAGQENNEIVISNYPNEEVIIDGSSIATQPSQGQYHNMIGIGGDYTIFKGFIVQYAALRSIVTGADHVTFDSLTVRNGYATGITIYGGSYNTIKNCTIYDLFDYDNSATGGGGGNADGISLNAGSGMPYPDIGYTVIKNNTIYNTSDDGIDTWSTRGNTIVNNIIYNTGFTNLGNGYTGALGLPAGNGNGIKLGGGGNSGYNIASNNISYNNRLAGFDGNSGQENKFYNNTAFNNPVGFRLLRANYSIKNNITYNNSSAAFQFTDAYPTDSSNNSWELNITNPQFASENPNDPMFLKLSASSPAIDAGTDLISEGVTMDINGTPRPQGLAFDIGAFEFSNTLNTPVFENTLGFKVFPNPTTNTIKIQGLKANQENTNYIIYNNLGQVIINKSLNVNKTINVSHLQKGFYFLKIEEFKGAVKILKQ